jgi:hypothetical protein
VEQFLDFRQRIPGDLAAARRNSSIASMTGMGFVPVKPVITSMMIKAGLTPNLSLPL